jgi:hypothetical protein
MSLSGKRSRLLFVYLQSWSLIGYVESFGKCRPHLMPGTIGRVVYGAYVIFVGR